MTRTQQIAFGVSALLMIGIGTSPAVISFCTVLLPLLALWQWHRWRWCWPSVTPTAQRMGQAMLALWALSIWSGWISGDWQGWGEVLYRKLPLLLLVFSYRILLPFSQRHMQGLALTLVATQGAVALLSLLGWGMGWLPPQDPLESGGHLRIVSGISPIYFSVTLGFSALLAAYLAWTADQALHPFMPQIWGLLAVLNAVALHFFTSRTGLLAFYAGGLCMLAFFVWRRRAWKLGGLGLLVALAMPLLAYQFFPSFRLRAQATWANWKQISQPGADHSFNSSALRLMAWRTTWELIEEKPILGRGLSTVQPALEDRYRKNGAYEQVERPLINPHNQYLTYWAGLGLPGLMVLLLVVFLPPYLAHGPPRMLAFALSGALFVALMFENVLERQIGMTFFCVIYLWLPFWQPGKQAKID